MFRSINFKLLVLVAGSLLLAFAVSLTVSETMQDRTYQFTYSLLDRQISEREQLVSRSVDKQTNDILNTSILLASQMSLDPGVIAGIQRGDKTLVHRALAAQTALAKQKVGIDLVWVTRLADRKSDGATPILACPSNPAFDGFDKLNYQSVNQALDSGQVVPSWEVNEEDGKLQISAPIIAGGKTIGAVVVGRQVYQSFIQATAETTFTGCTAFFTMGENDFYVMTDAQTDDIGKVLFGDSHEKLKTDAKNVSVLAKERAEYAELKGILDGIRTTKQPLTKRIDLVGRPYVTYFKPLTDSEGHLAGVMMYRFSGIGELRDQFDQEVGNLKLLYFVVIGLMLPLITVIGFVFASQTITRPIGKTAAMLRTIAQGNADLSLHLEVRSQDEIGQMLTSFNDFLSKLKQLVIDLKNANRSLNEMGADLASSAVETAASVNQISSNIQGVQHMSEKQIGSLSTVSGAVEGISQGIENLDALVESQGQSSSHASAAVEQMVASIDSVNKSIERMSQEFDSLVHDFEADRRLQVVVGERIQTIASQSVNLMEANEMIANIAAQTKLLSMNAAIEAAHAGESGRGFSVVANEIRKLAETADAQSKGIQKELNAIEVSVKAVVEAAGLSGKSLEAMSGRVSSTNQLVREIRSSMGEQNQGSHQVLDALKSMNQLSGDVRAASHQMAQGNRAIRGEMQELKEISDTIRASMDEMTRGAEDITKATSGVSQLAEDSRRRIQEVDGLIGSFKT